MGRLDDLRLNAVANAFDVRRASMQINLLTFSRRWSWRNLLASASTLIAQKPLTFFFESKRCESTCSQEVFESKRGESTWSYPAGDVLLAAAAAAVCSVACCDLCAGFCCDAGCTSWGGGCVTGVGAPDSLLRVAIRQELLGDSAMGLSIFEFTFVW